MDRFSRYILRRSIPLVFGVSNSPGSGFSRLTARAVRRVAFRNLATGRADRSRQTGVLPPRRATWGIAASEYIFYVKNGKLPLDEALLAHMREHDFTVPALTDADLPFINEVLVAQNQIRTDS